MSRQLMISFPRSWVDVNRFEKALRQGLLSPHSAVVSQVVFLIPENCKLMIDSGLRLLSLANQLDSVGKEVVLDFSEGSGGTMGYLGRVGFFDYLCNGIEVLPERPLYSGAKVYRGNNQQLVEIANVNPEQREDELPYRLSEGLENNVLNRKDHKTIGVATFTMFSELIDNIFRHSSTVLDGFAALQVYTGGGRVKVVVSDSGDGILGTLRPSLAQYYPELINYSDTDIIVEAFRTGLSRSGKENGCGLQTCAIQAIKFNAELDVRLSTCRVHLTPSPDGYQPSTAYCTESIPEIWGTHICFDFSLDR